MQDILRESNNRSNSSISYQGTLHTSSRNSNRLGTLTGNIRIRNSVHNIVNNIDNNIDIDNGNNGSYSLTYDNRLNIDLDNRLNNWGTDTEHLKHHGYNIMVFQKFWLKLRRKINKSFKNNRLPTLVF